MNYLVLGLQMSTYFNKKYQNWLTNFSFTFYIFLKLNLQHNLRTIEDLVGYLYALEIRHLIKSNMFFYSLFINFSLTFFTFLNPISIFCLVHGLISMGNLYTLWISLWRHFLWAAQFNKNYQNLVKVPQYVYKNLLCFFHIFAYQFAPNCGFTPKLVRTLTFRS